LHKTITLEYLPTIIGQGQFKQRGWANTAILPAIQKRRAHHTLNDSPHPHSPLLLGLLNTNSDRTLERKREKGKKQCEARAVAMNSHGHQQNPWYYQQYAAAPWGQ
jgi:hypothetical protein